MAADVRRCALGSRESTATWPSWERALPILHTLRLMARVVRDGPPQRTDRLAPISTYLRGHAAAPYVDALRQGEYTQLPHPLDASAKLSQTYRYDNDQTVTAWLARSHAR